MSLLKYSYSPTIFGDNFIELFVSGYKDPIKIDAKGPISERELEKVFLELIERVLRDFIVTTAKYMHSKAISHDNQVRLNKLNGYADSISINRCFRYAKTMANLSLFEMLELVKVAKGTKWYKEQGNRMDLMQEWQHVKLLDVMAKMGFKQFA